MSPDDALTRVMSGRAWELFCDRLKSAGQTILRPEAPASEIDRAEGLRYLGRLTRIALEMALEHTDPDFPQFLNAPHATAKVGADSPDIRYLSTAITGAREYRLWGTRGTVPYLSFSTKGPSDGVMASTGKLDGKDLIVNSDGTFEIGLSRQPRPGNWLPLAAKSTLLLVRQVFLDRSRELHADVNIECVDGPATPKPLSAKRLDWGLKAAATFMTSKARIYADWAQSFQARPNTLQALDAELLRADGSDPNTSYLHGYWAVAADEALMIEARLPDCELWSFQLNNYWLESLDYRYFPVGVNKRTARYGPDGSVTFVIAASDPGAGNYLDTAGHRCGTMLLRVARPQQPPSLQYRLVKLATLKGPKPV
jgi:hypothetical protein